ncbi:MOSC domain-containing protein [Jiangella aurantiaca]|uniref:MOSC domain-containing protein n=1 Tax=Jiangella aurantiaca TaxID=2530373 RepID=A0A4V2YR14_9ACTN|nr:MOSC N-terminal beta barrel domain-containing protein [Jiangella aurantiaca]TDD64237.1 MOSC domain-containing protein [Jiangella aurantiaca]
MRVVELTIYPVKSTRGSSRAEAEVEPWGLADDRRWMVVDDAGYVVTARVRPTLLGVTVTPLGRGRIRLEGPHATALEVDGTASREYVPVQIWKNTLDAVRASAAADAWFAKLLDEDVRLVWLDDPTRRPVNPAYGLPADRVSFADAYPLLLTTTGSLVQLNDWVVEEALLRGEEPPAEPLPMRRFRPSVVVDSADPFTEDTWCKLRIGDVPFRAVKLCDRCVLTTIDPDTQARGKEPLRTLARHRRWDGKVWFGMNLVPDGTGRIAVGDDVEITAG